MDMKVRYGWVCDDCEDITLETRNKRPASCPCGTAANWRGRVRIYPRGECGCATSDGQRCDRVEGHDGECLRTGVALYRSVRR